MHTFVSLEIGSEQSGRRLGAGMGLLYSLLCKESVFWCRAQPADHILVPEAQCNGPSCPDRPL